MISATRVPIGRMAMTIWPFTVARPSVERMSSISPRGWLPRSFDARLGRREMLGHRAAQFLNRTPHDLPDLIVRGVRTIFGRDLLAAQLLLGLGRAEQIGGQLGRAHVG